MRGPVRLVRVVGRTPSEMSEYTPSSDYETVDYETVNIETVNLETVDRETVGCDGDRLGTGRTPGMGGQLGDSRMSSRFPPPPLPTPDPRRHNRST